MATRPRLRKFALTVHVVSSVGWLGAVAVFLALSVIGLTSASTTRAGLERPRRNLGASAQPIDALDATAAEAAVERAARAQPAAQHDASTAAARSRA